jgi:hypothetical protein
MERRNSRMFRRIEQLIAEGMDDQAAASLALVEDIEAACDRADDLRDREREERP